MSRTVATCGLLLVCLVMIAHCQTFQYSRGWTNGKRRDGPIVAGPSRITADHRLLEEFLSKFGAGAAIVLRDSGGGTAVEATGSGAAAIDTTTTSVVAATEAVAQGARDQIYADC
ncbi:hypothetical protein HPB52_003443 [Rhipicephalus sanguineus]|uniref:Pro-corazonin n=1 Tax=Rhipicephalus sanguineus TaxID=34632 RepID=A0A9D4QGS3_RHISA|nr:hypothetical protein HPB52_003443 [Rhipicephalus sanguineus]